MKRLSMLLAWACACPALAADTRVQETEALLTEAQVVAAAFPGYVPQTGMTDDPEVRVLKTEVHVLEPRLYVALVTVAKAPPEQQAYYTGGATAELLLVRQQREGPQVLDRSLACSMDYDNTYESWDEAQKNEPWRCRLKLQGLELRPGEWALSIEDEQGNHGPAPATWTVG